MIFNDYQIWIKQQVGSDKTKVLEFRFPVNPESFKIGNKTDVYSVDIEGIGEVVRVKDKNIKTISFSSELPSTYYSGCTYENIKTPKESFQLIDKMKDVGPVRLIITGSFIDMEAVITQFNVDEQGGDIGTLSFDIEFKEYRRPSLRQITMENNKAKVAAKPSRPNPRPQPKTYTVKSGDCLYNIAKGQLGNAQRWPEISKLNGINPPYLIFPNQTLRMP